MTLVARMLSIILSNLKQQQTQKSFCNKRIILILTPKMYKLPFPLILMGDSSCSHHTVVMRGGKY